MGSMDWSPQDLSYFGSFQGLLGIFSQSTVVVRFLRRFGSAGSFRVGSIFSAAAMFGISQSFQAMPSKVAATVVFLVSHFMWTGGAYPSVLLWEWRFSSLCYIIDVRACVPTGTPDNYNQTGHLSDHCRPRRVECCIGWYDSGCWCCITVALVTSQSRSCLYAVAANVTML